ncbi:MAG: M20/M25/M40 family metallo-hydrolase [candidate division WOR-3 bacterium]|nr:MAG: M20/M25/M40 family metallo-hydrolase [candidate division WOR-3 bacterium]
MAGSGEVSVRETRRVLGILKDLISIRSENPPGGSREILGYVKSFISTHTRARVVYQRVSKTRGNVIAVFGNPHILLNAHLDTVPAAGRWKHGPFHMVRTPKRVYGLGATDVKGAVAAMLAALQQRPPQNLMFVFNADEEDGLGESISYFLDSAYARRIEHAIVTEPTRCNIVTSHKGLYIFQTVFRGKAAHASEPHQGVNAIEKAAGFIRVLQKYHDRIKKRRYGNLRNPTISVDVITGGTKSNIVPDTCRFEIDRRTLPGVDHRQAAHEIRVLLKRYDPTARLKVLCSQPGFASTVSQKFMDMLVSCGAHTGCSVANFWTEGALFAGAGMKTVVCGPGSSRQAHTTDEFIEQRELKKAYQLYHRLFALL